MILEYKGVRLEIFYNYLPDYRAPRESLGQPVSPGQPEGVDILSVYVQQTDIISLLRSEMTDLEKAVLQEIKKDGQA